MFEAYKGEDLVLTVNTLDVDGSFKTNVASATISLYYLDGSGTKQYEVVNAAMIVQTGLCSYTWLTPEEPAQNDFLAEFWFKDSDGNEAQFIDEIKFLEIGGGTGSGTGGLTPTEHNWLYSAYLKTVNLSYDGSGNVKANIQYVKNDAVTGLADFQTDLTGINSQLNQILILASSTNSAVGSNVAQQTTLLSVLSLASATSIESAVIRAKTDQLSFTGGRVNANVDVALLGIATESTLDTALQHILYIRGIAAGRMKISIDGRMRHYGEDNSTLLATFQLKDKTGAPTVDPAKAYERSRV